MAEQGECMGQDGTRWTNLDKVFAIAHGHTLGLCMYIQAVKLDILLVFHIADGGPPCRPQSEPPIMAATDQLGGESIGDVLQPAHSCAVAFRICLASHL